MNRKIMIVLVALMAAVGDVWGQPLQLEHRQRAEQLLQLKCTEYDVDSVPVVAAWTYDMVSQELVLELVMRRISYDRVWFPLRHYERQEVKEYTRHAMNGKYRTRRPFRRLAVFGLDCVFGCHNCEFINENINTMEQEMIANGGSGTYRFHVDNPKNPVRIVIRGAVPMTVVESASGRMKYRYYFVSDAIRIELEVPSDPCVLPQSINLLAEVKALYRQMDEEFEHLAQANGRKDRKGCLDCKARFEKEFSEQYARLKKRYDEMPLQCTTIGDELNSIQDILEDAGKIKCPAPVPPPTGERKVYSNVAKHIKAETRKLERCTNALRAKRGVESARTNGQKIIGQIDELISNLSSRDSSDPKVREAVRAYELAKDSFNQNSQRK